jgi:HK97 family phage major capsid protein
MPAMTEIERDIRQKRASTYDGMVAVLEKVHAGTADDADRTEYDNRETELTKLDADLDRVLKAQKREAGRNEVAETRGMSRDEAETGDPYQRAYVKWFRRGMSALTTEEREVLEKGEQRAGPLSTTAGTVAGDAGYMIPQAFWMNLQIALKAYGGLLNVCNIVKTDSGNEMPWPTQNPTAIVGSYITENTQLGLQDYAFGQGIMYAWTITSNIILASLQIINDSAFDVDSFVTDRMGEAIGRKIAVELHTGTGTSALTGVHQALSSFTRVDSGGYYQPAASETAYWLAKGTTATATLANSMISFNSVLGMIHYIDPAYRASGRATFVTNDTGVTNLRAITDAYGHPLWQPNVQVGPEGDRLYGYPVLIDQQTPLVSSTASTAGGLYFGDFKTAMVIRQVNMAGSMRLTERYADFLQVGYMGWVRMDAQPNDLRAVVEYESGAS